MMCPNIQQDQPYDSNLLQLIITRSLMLRKNKVYHPTPPENSHCNGSHKLPNPTRPFLAYRNHSKAGFVREFVLLIFKLMMPFVVLRVGYREPPDIMCILAYLFGGLFSFASPFDRHPTVAKATSNFSVQVLCVFAGYRFHNSVYFIHVQLFYCLAWLRWV